jgi:hypothetical protein
MMMNIKLTPMPHNPKVSWPVSIGSFYVNLPEMGGRKKVLILLAQMRLDDLRKDLPHLFQSCTFNRSVTSPS